LNAAIALKKAETFGPLDANTRMQLVLAYISMGRGDWARPELERLAAADPEALETTLLIHPWVLTDFLDYNDFLEIAEAAVEELGYSGEIQVASFHPQYQFAGTDPDDPENGTNRSPYPTLHLLREASVERAVAAFGDTAAIYQKNIETLRRLARKE